MIIRHGQEQGSGGWQMVNWLAVAISVLFILLTQLSPAKETRQIWSNDACSSEASAHHDLTPVTALAQREPRDRPCAQHTLRF